MILTQLQPRFTRRHFSQMMLTAAGFAFAPYAHGERQTGPTMLLAPKDPFSGLDLLRVRYAAGRRPSDDISGLALTWRLTGEKDFADKALHEMSNSGLPAKPGSGNWLRYANWALAFDWLYEFPDFDPALKDRLSAQFTDVAAATLALPDLSHPSQTSFHNYSTRFLGLAAFTLCAASKHSRDEARLADLKQKTVDAFRNILQLTQLIVPCGSYHESMDYMRISYVPLAMLAELQRTTTGVDPARRFGVYSSFGETYLYKLLPDGTPSREGDNEYPLLDTRDTAALGYAVHRFKDPYAAWLLRESGFAVREWALPVLEFLWNDPDVSPRDPGATTAEELPRYRHFRGVDQAVFRNGWGSGSTRIEFDCGPYFAKHQHLDRGHFSIYHRGHLAIDSGADYTASESPHYLNYYRRTIAHNSMLVFDPAEKFFWSENVVEAANDGGQRMDSSRFWNTVRSLDDWERTRDLWDLGKMNIVDATDKYQYAMGDATRAYSPRKLHCFTRQLLYLPEANVLLIFDRVVSADPAFRKTWLLHSVDKPWIDGESTGAIGNGGEEFLDAARFRFQEGEGEILVHTLMPLMHTTTRRGGPGHEFWTPGDAVGGLWGTGRNWPLEPAEGGPLPTEPDLRAMWKKFEGDGFEHIQSSNRRNVVPGAWRIEVSPSRPAKEDLFIHLIEIGDRGTTGKLAVELLGGSNIAGAACSGVAMFLSAGDFPMDQTEGNLPSFPCHSLWLGGLRHKRSYRIEFAGSNLPGPESAPSGVPLLSRDIRSNAKGIAFLEGAFPASCRMRVHLV